jgi:hypothetical protein
MKGKRRLEAVLHAGLPSTMMETTGHLSWGFHGGKAARAARPMAAG